MRVVLVAIALMAGLATSASAQSASAPEVAAITTEMARTLDRLSAAALASDHAYDIVVSLGTEVGPRLGGSAAEGRARDWAVAMLRANRLSNVRIEPFTFFAWDAVREEAFITSGGGVRPMVAVALGGSPSTPAGGLEAEVARFPNMAALEAAPDLRSSADPLGVAPQRNHTHTFEGALAYTGAAWNARITSAYILGSDLQRSGGENTVRMQTLTAAIRPWNTLIITPTLGYREEIQNWSGTRIESPSASVAMQYRHNQRLWLSATGNYASTHSNDGLLDTQQVGGKGILAWDLQRSQAWATLLSFEAGYNRLTNNLSPSADVKDISGIIKLILAAH